MLKNYLKIALRNAWRQRGYAAINIVGLALGMCVCLLIVLHVRDEVSYDDFFENGDHIYRVNLRGRVADEDLDVFATSAPLAQTMLQDFPEVRETVRFLQTGRQQVEYGERRFYEEQVLQADSTLFRVFSYHLLSGDPNTALVRPKSVVLTQSIARKYFGDEDPMGKTLRFNNTDDYQVTGVMEDVPHNSHIRFDLLTSLSSNPYSRNNMWISNSFMTYVLLRDDATQTEVDQKFPQLVKTYLGPQLMTALGLPTDHMEKYIDGWGFYLEPIRHIYLHTTAGNVIGPLGNMAYVRIFSLIALAILLLAGINFVNLATARAVKRAREIGIRKVLGSSLGQLRRQFLLESILFSLIAMVIAVLAAELILPAFNNLLGKQLSFSILSQPNRVLLLLGIAAAIGAVAGIYPAMVLSSFRPAEVLKTKLVGRGRGAGLRKGLVVFQFTIAIMLFIGTGVVGQQLHFLLHKDLGFQQDHLLVLQGTDAAGNQAESLKNALLEYSGVTAAAYSESIPGRGMSRNAFRLEGAPEEETQVLYTFGIDEDFAETYGIQLASGEDFSKEMIGDTKRVLINASAARAMGYQSGATNRLIAIGPTPEDARYLQIAGLMQDFHFESLRLPIGPMALTLRDGPFGTNYHRYLTVKIRPENMQGTLAYIKKTWDTYLPGKVLNYFFLEDDFNQKYLPEQRTAGIAATLSGIAIFIAALGLLGLAAYNTEQRTKEVGIRKVLGASVPGILGLFSREITILVGLAALVALPMAWYGMHRWLQGFAYRIGLPPLIFVLAVILALLVAVVTVSSQALRAARANPTTTLRYE